MLFTQPPEEANQRLDLAVLANPEQPLAALIDLVHDSQVFTAFFPLYLVNAKRCYIGQILILATPYDRHLY